MINLLTLADAIKHQGNWSTLAQVMACCLTASSPSSEPKLIYHQWGPVAITWGIFLVILKILLLPQIIFTYLLGDNWVKVLQIAWHWNSLKCNRKFMKAHFCVHICGCVPPLVIHLGRCLPKMDDSLPRNNESALVQWEKKVLLKFVDIGLKYHWSYSSNYSNKSWIKLWQTLDQRPLPLIQSLSQFDICKLWLRIYNSSAIA